MKLFCIFRRKKLNIIEDKEIQNQIIKSLKGTAYQLVSFFRDYKTFGNMIVIISDGEKEHTFITDRGEIVFDKITAFPSTYKREIKNSTVSNLLESIDRLIKKKIMRYVTEREKSLLIKFINYPIPLGVKDNKIDYKCDLMECYEELFNSSHNILDEHYVQKAEIFCIFDDEFMTLLNTMRDKLNLQEFAELAKSTVKIIKKYSI
ncbi:hypothetical protein RJI07_03605 [Mycoplasmatota bacterium WC30]